MKDASADIFKAVRGAILADVSLAALLGTRVFQTYANQNEASPLVRMSIPAVRNFEVDGGGEGGEHDLYVNVFTEEPAPTIARQIANKIRDALAGPLTLDDADLVSLDYSDTVHRRDDQNPNLQMIVLRFLIIATTH